jgi:DNA-binding transcriptional regulator YhcF (GntR family)
LFELDNSVRESAKQLGLAYNTVYHLYQTLRHAIIISDSDNGSFSGEIEMDESYSVGEEKETGAGELPGRSRYLGSWSEAVRLRSK